ncbi:MAG: Coenzyme F420 hydrogenase/dehydrogenase, beta subunit C-terminal domain [Ruminococcus sp.]|nr:Coenzyme F420 hydrogenase/dehydrogenase, beta subunit C-terminal domain [Ruminococcus sp.]
MNWREPQVYAVKHSNSQIRAASRSGGIFTAISDVVLENDGVIYGCVLTEDFEAIHIRATATEDRNRMRGSKYIQSNMGDVFQSVKTDLDDGKQVLFSGTSCQVAGLKGFLRKEYDNLICVDIVCHGVPSPRVWKEYLKWQEERNGKKIKSVDFRNKKDHGWAAHVESLYFDDETRVDSKVFKTLFYRHAILRPCCYKCPYKQIMHPGDISIADYWGIDKAAPGFNDNKGVSLVLINNDTGRKFFDAACENIEYRECDIKDSMQMSFIKPYARPDNRDNFWSDFNKAPFTHIAKKYGDFGLKNDILNVLRNIKKKLVR